VYLHGLAADLWAADNGPVGMTARDLANLIPAAIKQHREA
jgi:NAD(P)H-hydrate repair Nnr-like enzyme with NAD(P)H-hydrate dehydratase domain